MSEAVKLTNAILKNHSTVMQLEAILYPEKKGKKRYVPGNLLGITKDECADFEARKLTHRLIAIYGTVTDVCYLRCQDLKTGKIIDVKP